MASIFDLTPNQHYIEDIKLIKLAEQLDNNEWKSFAICIPKLFDSRWEYLQALLFAANAQRYITNVREKMNNFMTKIIQNRKKNDNIYNDNFNDIGVKKIHNICHLPTSIIGELSSYLDQVSYGKFSQSCRDILIQINSPNKLYKMQINERNIYNNIYFESVYIEKEKADDDEQSINISISKTMSCLFNDHPNIENLSIDLKLLENFPKLHFHGQGDEIILRNLKQIEINSDGWCGSGGLEEEEHYSSIIHQPYFNPNKIEKYSFTNMKFIDYRFKFDCMNNYKNLREIEFKHIQNLDFKCYQKNDELLISKSLPNLNCLKIIFCKGNFSSLIEAVAIKLNKLFIFCVPGAMINKKRIKASMNKLQHLEIANLSQNFVHSVIKSSQNLKHIHFYGNIFHKNDEEMQVNLLNISKKTYQNVYCSILQDAILHLRNLTNVKYSIHNVDIIDFQFEGIEMAFANITKLNNNNNNYNNKHLTITIIMETAEMITRTGTDLLIWRILSKFNDKIIKFLIPNIKLIIETMDKLPNFSSDKYLKIFETLKCCAEKEDWICNADKHNNRFMLIYKK